MNNRGKIRKILNDAKPVENIDKNLQSFLKIVPLQEGFLPSHKLQGYTYEQQNPFGLKEYDLSERNCHNQLIYPILSH